MLSEDHILIKKNSSDIRKNSYGIDYNISKTNAENQSSKKKDIDKEHVTIERIFRISLEESDKFLYLELYLAQILSYDKEVAFRIKDLDEIVINIINSREHKETTLPYLLETYHRAVEMIEKRYKSEYDNSYKQIRRVIGNYITLIINSPENFDLNVCKKDMITHLNKYFADTDDEELGYFLMDIYHATSHDMSFLGNIFSFLFEIIFEENNQSKSNFFNQEKLRKNMMILGSLFEKCPLAAQAFVQESRFIQVSDGKSLQFSSYLGQYLNVAVFEADVNQLRTNFPLTNMNYDSIIKNYTIKLNEYLNDLVYFLYTIYSANDVCRYMLFQWLYTFLSFNFDRMKLYQNNNTTSTIGFLLNCLIVLLKVLLESEYYYKQGYDFIFSLVADFDPLFTLSTDKIKFGKIDRVNNDLIKEILCNVDESEYNDKNYTLNTQIFFAIHFLMDLTIKSFDNEINMISTKYNDLIKDNKINDPIFKDLSAILKASTCYLKNPELSQYILKFSEITSVFLFSLNNKKFPQINFSNMRNYLDYIENFHSQIDTSDNFALSLLPAFIPRNIVQICIFLRNHNPDVLFYYDGSSTCTKVISYFAIIYSSQADLIRNSHLRSEIIDILFYFFVSYSTDKNHNHKNCIYKLLNDNFIQKNLINSLMRVFVDAERLGTSNQFYEKFSIRHKIFYLIESISKVNNKMIDEKILEYANSSYDDCSRMINLLMNDLTFLNDECIERLMDIKRFQDLKEDITKFNSLDEETKKFEESKFQENDRRIRTELKLFTSSMEFMVRISEICQDYFLKYKLGEKLANLLNYSLDVFTSERGLKLKIKNMNEYGFDPKFILVSLVLTYVSFVSYQEFLEYIVKDDRSYKIINFEKVMKIYNRGKIKINFDVIGKFDKLIQLLKDKEIEIKIKTVNYDDAPDEFYDPITTLLMDDPILLPDSKVIVDRQTIETHLLSDPTDPFNRSKLSRDMLIPQIELKMKINEYKISKIQK